jgi:hypothetical protein
MVLMWVALVIAGGIFAIGCTIEDYRVRHTLVEEEELDGDINN